jgi:YVTN family beta-propeller protein
MIRSFFRRSLRRSFAASKFTGAALLLGLLALSGCGDESSVGVTTPSLQSIEITPGNPSIAAGTSTQLTATAIYSDSSHADVTTQVVWGSSNPAIATAEASTGKAQAVSVGSVILSAKLQGDTASTTLTVTAATLVSIAITPPTPSIALGTTQPFTATGTYTDNSTQNLTTQVSWTSATASVATISNAIGSNGVARSVSAGTSGITAAMGHVTSAPISLTVSPATLLSIAVTPPSPSIALGTTQPFTATGTYSDNSTQNLTTQVSWTSATISVATISNAIGSDGVARSVATGTSGITAAMGHVTSAPISLTVSPATLVSIAVTPPSPSIALGTTQPFTATGTYSDNSTQNLSTQVTWASATGSVATISNAIGSNGLASSVATGTSGITATLGGIGSAPVTLTISPATLVSIAVSSLRPKIALGITRPLTATGTYTDDSTQDLTSTATWLSSAPSNLSISNASGSQGEATGLATGAASASASVGTVTSPSLALNVTIAQYAYAANSLDNTVSQYAIDAGGALSALTPATVGVGATPLSITVDPTGRYAYVANANNGTMSQFMVGAGGALSPLTPATVAGVSDPASVTVDPTGRYAYVANSNDSTVSQFLIGAGGALGAMTPATVGSGQRPSSVSVDPTGRYVYVGNVTDNTVSQYTIDAGGALSAMTPATIGAGQDPFSVTVDPTGRYVYAANAGDNTVSQYTIGAGGALSAMTSPTVGAGMAPYFITVDPTGRYVYAANANNGTVSQYTIGAGGALSAMSPAMVSAGLAPHAVTVDPTGRYAYVSNDGDNDVFQYSIGSGGALSAMSTVGAGMGPYSFTTTD